MKLNWNIVSKYRNHLYGLSILWIIVFHVFETFGNRIKFDWISTTIFRNGNIGVDIFLFLSGISMFYSFKKTIENKGTLIDFYKKRFSKVLKVYLCFCIPFLFYVFIILYSNINSFLKELFFVDNNVSWFWYIFAICICYLIYPLIYKALETQKKYLIVIFCILYICALGVYSIIFPSNYEAYEILLSRIPIFCLGSIVGPLVYYKKEVNPYILFIVIVLLFANGPIFYILKYFPYYFDLIQLYNRLYMGIFALGAIMIIVIFLQYFESFKLFKFISNIGTFTLEIYVVHIALRFIFINTFGLNPQTNTQIFCFMLIYAVSSLIFGKLLNIILSKI